MPDSRYCYPDSDVLINKLNITSREDLFEAEKELTYLRLMELQGNPLEGDFDYRHLRQIHQYIFQDIYEWAGKIRTVEIGKGNLFCTTAYLESYGETVFANYFSSCFEAKDDFDRFIRVFSSNYADLNALHPFREGNGRAQREFARLVCMKCGYVLDLSCTSHKEMLEASILSFEKGDNTGLEAIFYRAVISRELYKEIDEKLRILSVDDMLIDINADEYFYEYYEADDEEFISKYNEYYQSKTGQRH